MSATLPFADLLHQRDGHYTREMLLAPGGFGLGVVPDRQKPDATTASTCGFCSTGCSLTVHLKEGEAVGLTPNTDYPVNLGMACPKGWEALNVLKAPDRATTPLLRNAHGKFEPVDWDIAMRVFCSRFKQIQNEHGPEAVAWLGTGQIATEELALLGSLAKFGMGMIHGDGNTRQCMATAVVAYKQSFGFDAPPYTYQDFEETDCMVLVGANVCIAHPILWERVMRNKRSPEIIVVDPRRTETAMNATQHLALRPKSDLALFYGVAHILIENDWLDRDYIAAHTTGFREFAAHVKAFPPAIVSAQTGIPIESLYKVARTIHERERVSFWWTMGINQSYEGVRAAQALINLALMTGNIGRPGTGANSITGQCNAMGSRLFSNTTNLLGGRDFTSEADRADVAQILRIDAGRIPTQNSWAYPEIMKGILDGKIKGLWVVATNPSHSWINQHQAKDILDRLDFLVVQDMYSTTETAREADLILPAAAWGEKEGTFINSERRYGLHKKVAKAPGDALADFHIFQLVAHYWGCEELFQEWRSPEAAFQIMKRLSAGQPCDITGIRDYQHLDDAGGIQWPFAEGVDGRRLMVDGEDVEPLASSDPQPSTLDPQPSNQRRLFENGRYYHDDGRAKFLFEAPRPMPEPPSAEYPFILLTGRGTAAQWHTQTRTGKSAVLRKLSPQSVYV
ncbi:MAG: molybdopterin-dependent oxidoreductase, partial [Candidatus Saccharimonas sp.]|nr:molybdopterin-dependent oxidoreductase [Planctomycetaceae bacterium]